MFKILAVASDYKSVLVLAEAVLGIRPKEKAEEQQSFISESPFYLKDVGRTKIFEFIQDIDNDNLENAIQILTDVLSEIIIWGQKESKETVFKVYDSFALFDVDFYELETDTQDRLSSRDDIKNLAAVIKKLAEEQSVEIVRKRV